MDPQPDPAQRAEAVRAGKFKSWMSESERDAAAKHLGEEAEVVRRIIRELRGDRRNLPLSSEMISERGEVPIDSVRKGEAILKHASWLSKADPRADGTSIYFLAG